TKLVSYRLTILAKGSASPVSHSLYQAMPGAANSTMRSNPPVTSIEWMQFGELHSLDLSEATSAGVARRSNSMHKIIRNSPPLLPFACIIQFHPCVPEHAGDSLPLKSGSNVPSDGRGPEWRLF